MTSAAVTGTSPSPPPDLDTALTQLAGQGIEPERPPYTVSENGPRLCFVRDPDGYRVELIEQG